MSSASSVCVDRDGWFVVLGRDEGRKVTETHAFHGVKKCQNTFPVAVDHALMRVQEYRKRQEASDFAFFYYPVKKLDGETLTISEVLEAIKAVGLEECHCDIGKSLIRYLCLEKA